MIRHLTSRFILAFAAVAFVATIVTSWMDSTTIHSQFRSYVASNQLERSKQLSTLLQNYYQVHQQWNSVNDWIQLMGNGMQGKGMGMENMMGNSMPRGASSEHIIVADANGKIVADNMNQALGQDIGSMNLIFEDFPLVLQNKKIGTLYIERGSISGISPLEKQFTSSLNISVFWSGLIAVLIAVGLGVFFASRLASPIKGLTRASQKVADGNLSLQVPIPSNDEVGQLAKSFNQMVDQLNKNELLRKNLVADVAHELRTPLAIMRGQLESMLSDTTEINEGAIAMLHDEMVRLSYLVQDLQNITLAESGHLTLHRQPTRIQMLIGQVVEAFSYEADTKKVCWNVNMDSNIPPLELDPLRMEQVIVNLVANAIRHTPESGTISIQTKKMNQAIIITLENTGTGIPEEDIPYIFERFYRVDASRARSTGGSGLGLAIAKGFVEVHDGTISVENVKEGGIRFTIQLPLSTSLENKA